MTANGAIAQSAPSGDGIVRLDGVSVPPSNLLSPEAREDFRHVVTLMGQPVTDPPRDLKAQRERVDDLARAQLGPMEKRYAVKIREARIGGVFVQIVSPVKGVSAENSNRVLLEMHGGAFMAGSRTTSLLEAIPVAATMGVKVIAIDYRMAPEFEFPAASEDVADVYREILKSHEPSQVGVYGCSAGGILAGQSVAWFQTHGLPKPGAVGVFCASLGGALSGDSGRLAAALTGARAPNTAIGAPPKTYLANARLDDPLAYPVTSSSVLARFPPTLFITATRSVDMSAAINSHNQLSKAGVETELFIWDGLYHAFIYNSELPESREAYAVMTRFFEKHLSR
jgi:acetyl esterase/lipase